MPKVLRFTNGARNTRNARNATYKTRVIRRVVRRTPVVLRPAGARPTGVRQTGSRPMPTRVLQQPITRWVADRPEIDSPGAIAIYGGFEFSQELHECLDPLDSIMIVGTVETGQSMVAMTAMSKADLAIIELDFGGDLAGLNVARTVAANSPACGIMVYTPALTPKGFKALWIYGSEQWSIITRASLANPAHIRATVKSVVRGLPWTEPGVQRQWAELGDRPRTVESRRLLMRTAAERRPGAGRSPPWRDRGRRLNQALRSTPRRLVIRAGTASRGCRIPRRRCSEPEPIGPRS